MNLDPEKFADGLLDVVDRAIRPLAERIRELEARATKAEERGLQYSGTWQRAQSYRRGDSVTSDGSLWICLSATEARPGVDATWQLAAKKGRDGRDAKGPA